MKTIYDGEIKIYTADDSSNYNTTNLSVKSDMRYEETYDSYRRYRYEQTDSVMPNRFTSESEPTIAALKYFLVRRLNLNKKGVSDFNTYITIGKEEPLTILFSKIGTRYHLMGEMQSKDTIVSALSRVIYRSCFEKSQPKLYAYMLHHLRLPENVSYALENRAPFHWYVKAKKIEVRFNIKMIGDDECAMEISDGVWAPISVKNLNVYMNYYWKGQDRGSWKFLSPKRLWKKLLKEEPTEGQLKMMIAFLGQNRTDDLVQSRAIQLVKDMEKQYSNKMKVLWYDAGANNDKRIKAMLVKGVLADWIITDNEYKSEIQAVSTYVYKSDSNNSSGKFLDSYIGGPICIDNMTKKSSIGDQFAARAMALFNDKLTVKLVNTINRYLDDAHVEGQYLCRIDFDEFNHKNIDTLMRGVNQ